MILHTKFIRSRPLKFLKIKADTQKTGFIISEFINKCTFYYKIKKLRPTSSIVIYLDTYIPNLKKIKFYKKSLETQFSGTLIQKYYNKRCSKSIKRNNIVIVKRLLNLNSYK